MLIAAPGAGVANPAYGLAAFDPCNLKRSLAADSL
jgi:hypothetical protein